MAWPQDDMVGDGKGMLQRGGGSQRAFGAGVLVYKAGREGCMCTWTVNTNE